MNYIRLGIIGVTALIIMTLTALMYMYRGNAIAAKAAQEIAETNVKTAEAANKSQQAALDKITEFRKIDDALIVDMQRNLTELNQRTAATIEAVRTLERTSADAKAYLDGLIPDDLRRVLNNARETSPKLDSPK